VSNSLNQPLVGLKVVDLTQIYQGPYAAFLMASAGADVIKVEPPGGERMRGAGGAKTPMAFAMLNSNKRSVTLNLKTEQGQNLLRELVVQADVMLENYAPGTLDKLGLGWDALHKLNPKLIYVSGTGYGLSGQDTDLLAMDHTIQAASGVMASTGDPEQPPSRAGGAPCDIMGGIHMYAGAMSALVGRGINGKGTRVEISMLESMYFTLCSEFSAYYAGDGSLPKRNSARSPSAACPYGRYRCQDGWLAIISVAESHWQSILKTIGRDDLLDHPDYANSARRLRRETEVNALIEAWTSQHTRDQAYAEMRAARVPVAPVRTIDEVQELPHLHERGMLHRMNHPDLGEVILPSSPIRFSDYEAASVRLFPQPGEHNAEVLKEWLALSDADVTDLQTKGVL
jgi:CoA:oxalate CoA-transferase